MPSQGHPEPVAPPRAPATLHVGTNGDYATIEDALRASVSGDSIVVHAGVYHERPVVRTAVSLVGRRGAVVDGGGEGTVLSVEAPALVTGLTVRGSGRDQSREDAGILVQATEGAVIADNTLLDVLFGIYVKQSRAPTIRGNDILGKDLPMPRRGDGIRLWYCEGGSVEDNTLRRTRDLVIWFSSHLRVRNNLVTRGRYGLHYMYSDHNVFEDNTFVENDVGAFLMYSADIRFRHNRFMSARGASGIGLGLKDADDIVAEDNVFVGNLVGIFLDNSPTSVDARNRFRHNLIAHNQVGISLLPAVRSNVFSGNAWLANGSPVIVSGGGSALENSWDGNHWSEYAGFDQNGDGVGDTPFQHDRLSDDLFARHPELRILAYSPAVSALEVVARLFPLLRPQPVVVDRMPLLRPPPDALHPVGADRIEKRSGSGWVAGVMFGASAVAASLLGLAAARPKERVS